MTLNVNEPGGASNSHTHFNWVTSKARLSSRTKLNVLPRPSPKYGTVWTLSLNDADRKRFVAGPDEEKGPKRYLLHTDAKCCY